MGCNPFAVQQGNGGENQRLRRERIAFGTRPTRSNRCVHEALQRTLITFLSREIHSRSFRRPGKIILQIPAMPLGLF
jgi:hypothetical protein